MNPAGLKLSESSERIDTLLALAFTFSRSDDAARAAGEQTGDDESADEPAQSNPLELLSELRASDRRAVEKRASWLLKLPEQEQLGWVAATLGQARGCADEQAARLDENIHPSHIIEALRPEPERVQSLVLSRLPLSMAQTVGEALAIAIGDSQNAGARAKDTVEAAPASNAVNSKIATVARRAFFSNFVTADQVIDTACMDNLSGVELARLVRLIGARETAIACRGVDAVETLSAFLRCFSAEDSHAIAAFISALTNIEPERVSRAGAIVRSTMDAGAEREALLDRIGLSLIACALRARSEAARRYTAQKLPVEAARALMTMIDNELPYEDGESLFASEEIEALVAGLRSQATSESL